MRRFLTTPRRFLIAVGLCLSIITTAVPVIAWLQRPAGTVYTGYSYESYGDIFVYLNFIEQAKNGAPLFTQYFVSVPHAPALFNPLFLVMGWTARLLHLPALVAWHLGRIALLWLFLWMLWKFLRRLSLTEGERHVAVLSVVATGAVYLNNRESATFLSLLSSPMAIASIILPLVYFLTVLRTLERGLSWRRAVMLLAIAALQATVQPYTMPFWAVLLLTLFFVEAMLRRRTTLRSVGLLLWCVLPIVMAYSAVVFVVLQSDALLTWSQNAVFRTWRWQHVVSALLPLLPLAAVGAWRFRSRLATHTPILLLVLWLPLALAFSQSPYPYASRTMLLAHLPLAMLAAIGGAALWRAQRARFAVRSLVLLLFVLSLSDNLHHLVANATQRFDQYGNSFVRVFSHLTPDDQAALRWLRTETPKDAVILSAPVWDTLLAGVTHRYPYVTVMSARKEQRFVEAWQIYAGQYDADQLRRFVAERSIGYITVSDRDRLSGWWEAKQSNLPIFAQQWPFAFDPSRYPFLELAFQQGTFAIYRVTDVAP